jgi:hypothetical protein
MSDYKMGNTHPLLYQRPQAAPTMGNIRQAEKAVEQLRAAGSLARRFARLDEVQAIWRPQAGAMERAAGGGLFGHLRPKGSLPAGGLTLPGVTMTWEKFQRVVLPTAEQIDFYVPTCRENYTAFCTAVNPDAPSILQWDLLEKRNPVSWYVWYGGSLPIQFGLMAAEWCPVTAITLQPSSWFGAKCEHQGEAVVFLLEGARETRIDAGAAIFPETLKSEFHGIRATIEAYSRSAELSGREAGSACGIRLQKGASWPNALFRVRAGGNTAEYRLDRWD